MITYESFMKHADKVCKNVPEVRPVLKGVMHMENGDAVCTDAMRLYVAKEIQDRKDGSVITPTGKKVEGSYPNFSKLIPDPAYANQSIQFELSELLKAADIMASVGGVVQKDMYAGTKEEPKPAAVDFLEGRISYHNFQCTIHYSVDPIRFESPVCLNANFLLDAMKLFKAAGCQNVTYNFFGSMRPVTFTNEDESLLVLILPIRKY